MSGKSGHDHFCVTGQGSGSVGLPGDPSPPSRFVKTYFLLATALPVKNAAESLVLAQHIINNVDIPLGLSRDKMDNSTVYDYTQWVVFKDLTHRKFYYRTYHNMALHMVDMNKLDFSEKAHQLRMALITDAIILDDTSILLGSTL